MSEILKRTILVQNFSLKKVDSIKIANKLQSEQLFKISPFKQVIKRTKPHKHDAYFEIISLSEGAGFHWVDTQKFQINPPVVFFLSGQLHYWEMTAIPKGFVMLFKEDIVIHGDLLGFVRNLDGFVNIDKADVEVLEFIFSEMEKEYKNPSANSTEMIHGYLKIVLIKLLRNKQLRESTTAVGLESIYTRFLQFIQNSHPISNLKVSDVASSLNVSPQHLNTILRKVKGKSASELINEQVILEAKRYLLHTDKTVSEIAFELSFTDPSHFVKHFRKSTGQTPQSFRKQHFQ